jgi:hypothetical protein
MDQIPALSQEILTSAYAWALCPVLLGASGDDTVNPWDKYHTYLLSPHCQQAAARRVIALFPTADGDLSQRGDLLGLGT